MARTLRSLVEQYRTDVEIRIESLRMEREEVLHEAELGEEDDIVADVDDQIAHWEATLAQINETLQTRGAI